MISSASLLYFMPLGDGLRIGDIFWFGVFLQVVILVARPRIQDCFFTLFYPKNLTNWKSNYEGDESARRRLNSGRIRSA